MTVFGSSRLASRSCILIRLTSLANWGKCGDPYKFSSNTLNRCHHQANKCQPWGKSSNRNCAMSESSNFYSNFIYASQRRRLKLKNAGIHKVSDSCPRRSCAFSERRAREEQALFGLSQKSQHVVAVQNAQIIRSFHVSPALKAAPVPVLWMILKPAQKLLAIILGRSIRKWWHALPSNKKELFKESAKRNKWKLVLGVCSLGIIYVVFYFTHLEETPITGRPRLLVFRKEHFAELSQLECDVWLEEFKNKMLPETNPLYQVVKKVVSHLTESNKDVQQISEFSWSIHVVEDPAINAFVLPNGQVFVFTGLLTAVSDIHQLSFILGHEIAHAVLGHAAEKASLVHFLDFLSVILLTLIWAVCPRDSLAILGQWIQTKFQELMFHRPYSRTLEAEADKVGLQFAAKACMDIRASSVFWQQMELAEAIQGQPKLPEWLSTHPSHENRAEHLDKLIPEAIKLRESCNCPALPGQDPRLLFKLSLQHLGQAFEKEEGYSTTQHDFDKAKVTLSFVKKGEDACRHSG